jgi:hypothetical protein
MRRLTPEHQQKLLQAFAHLEGHELFALVGSLHIVLRDHALPPAFLAGCFADLLRLVERDFAQDGVWKSILTVCEHRGDAALQTLRLYVNDPDERRCSIAAFMLGILRSASLQTRSAEFARLEDELRDHADCQLRAVFNWSWVTTSRERELTQDELNDLFTRAENSPDDLNNVACVTSRLIAVGSLSIDLARQCRHWVSRTVGPSLSSEAKHHVVLAADHLQRADDGEATADATAWIKAIQPLSADHVGTWERIGDFLCELLKRNRDDLTMLVIELCRTSASTMQELMAGGYMRRFLHGLRKVEVNELVAKLALSVETPTRRLGLYLFNELDVSELPNAATLDLPKGGTRGLC